MGENEIERYPGKRNGMPQQVIYTSPAFHESLQPVMDRLKSEQSEVLQHFPTVRFSLSLLPSLLSRARVGRLGATVDSRVSHIVRSQ